ncbi:MAG: IS66 family transposase [Phycisphaerae bacterium]|nr:IS66 family transposase [Phycisphaerae bacterium]
MARTRALNASPEQELLDAALRGELSEAQARQLAQADSAAIVLILLALTRRIGQLQRRSADPAAPTPATPSGMVAVYAKPTVKRRAKRPGARNGHPGARRAPPARIDQRIEHRALTCPDCGGPLQCTQRCRTRIIEDIPEEIQPVVTEHTIHRDYCPGCKKDVEPVVPDAMPGATLGHRIVVLTAWLHYGLGVTLAQAIDILGYHLQTTLTPGGLVDAWRRLAEILKDWYEQIAEEARKSAVLHADETGWRVNGQTRWLWCFATQHVCYYRIDRCRGSPALQKFFIEAFAGTLVTDFWAAYLSIDADDRQYCLVHLLREMEKVDLYNRSAEWCAFAKKLRRLIHDGFRLRKRPDFSPQRYAGRIALIDRRLSELATWRADDGRLLYRDDGRLLYHDADALRLAKRLRKHWNHLFTFLDKPDVPFDNNLAERMIRPAVIIRKNSLSNRSEQGAATQTILMSVYRTLKLRGHDPIRTIVAALRTYLQTGKLPPLPPPVVANG